MGAISTAVGIERLSRTSGYRIKKGFFSEESSNLPQVIAILAEANTANQASLDETKREITSADEAGQLYGYGSPIHQIMRILRPTGSDGVGGIPTIVIPQKSDPDAEATEIRWQISGSPTKNYTHTIRIAGRTNLDYKSYTYSVLKDESPEDIVSRIADTVNAVLNSPVIASANGQVLILRTKWAGNTSRSIRVGFGINDDLVGLNYANVAQIDGTGSVDLSGALNQMENDWFTTVINSYGEEVFEILEQFNGVPYSQQPTGRYSPMVFKPFMAFFGSVLSNKDDLQSITNNSDRIEQVTHVLCPAPNSDGLPWEAAANVVRLFTRTMQDSPEIDVNGQSYPDMPIPFDDNIGDMSSYENRDYLIKKGCSTVILDKGSYKIQDLVTTYHPAGETPLQYNYCRNLNLDWNIFDAYRIIEINKLRDKVLIRDNQTTDSQNAIKPKEWKAILFDFFDDMAKSALINDPDFTKKSLTVQVSPTNPNRFETFFRYKRTGIARIESTDVEAGF